MSRETKADYEKLELFMEEFSLSNVLDEADLHKYLKLMHKSVFSLMTFVSEVEQRNKNVKFFSDKSLAYLKESVSDIGQALFCWINGAYKPANLVLRSSVETFIKAIIGQENEEVFSEKSMYKVFDMAKGASFFCSGLGRECYETLHFIYKELCKIVHTAGQADMAHVSALKAFPSFSSVEGTSANKNFLKVSEAIVSTLFVAHYKFVHEMHPKNQVNFMGAVPKELKKKISDYLD